MAKGSASQHALRKYQHDEGPYWALVTGATNGMGYEWASQLAALGFSILLHGRSEAKLEKTKAEILAKLEDNHSIEIRLVVADAGLTPPNLAGLNEALADEKMNLRVVVNNIGITNEDYPLLEDLGEEDVLKMVALNATFPTLVARKTLPLLKKQSNTPSLMVNVASLGAWAPSPYLSIYGGTKAYNLQFSRSLYNEMVLEDKEVDVVCMVPGTVISGMNEGPPTNFMPLSSTWVQAAISSLASSTSWFGGGGFSRLPPVIVPWGAHSRGLKFLNMMPTSIGDKLTRNFVRDAKQKKNKDKAEAQ